MMEWISVEDRLPEDSDFVLTAGTGACREGMCVLFHRPEPSRWINTYTRKEWEWPVTHWMPLPEPPEVVA